MMQYFRCTNALLYWMKYRGADFHRAMMATAPGEKRRIGRLSMRN